MRESLQLRPIRLSTGDFCSAEKSLNLPLPEMTFGNNSLHLTYRPASSSENLVELRFATLDALAGVAVGEGWEERVGGGVKVSMAETWGKSRSVYKNVVMVVEADGGAGHHLPRFSVILRSRQSRSSPMTGHIPPLMPVLLPALRCVLALSSFNSVPFS